MISSSTTLRALLLTVAALPAAAIAQPAPPLAGTRLEIVARGEVTRVPDVALVSAGVVTQARDARTAMSQNATQMSAVVAALRRAGVADRDIATAQISLAPQYRYAENVAPVITGYQASNSVSVRLRDIARSGGVLDALVGQGANQISGPTLSIDKPAAALDEARLAAMKLARARADLYAGAAGLKVARIISITEGQDYNDRPPVPMVSMMMRDQAAPKTEIVAGEQAVGVSLSVTFELD